MRLPIARIAGATLAPLAVAGLVIAQGGIASAGTSSQHGGALYVSQHAKPSAADRSCGSAGFKTIQSAINAAPAGGTVVVCPGVYHEQVVVAKPLSLQGRGATIDETNVKPALKVSPPGVGTVTIFAGVVIVSSHVGFSGFKVTNALGEGILAAGVPRTISGVSISHNVVVHNDLGGGVPPVSTYFECAAQGSEPGDCGEGIHLLSVAYSQVTGNRSANNSGGILLTDELGPTDHNLIADNTVTGNASDCGITVPGHNPAALNSAGKRQPSVAGVYDNVISGNSVTGNGLKGEGAGVLFANASAGTASYNNLVTHNYIEGNGLSGVTMHAHTLAPGKFEDLSGNTVIDNVIGKNNIDGDPLDAPKPPQDKLTTGVLVFSGGTHVTVTVAHNSISDNHFGIWLSKPVKAQGVGTNSFHNVTVPVSANN
ncbi:MAG TPA: NosD domain-containing protein [Streptosporangiaceae bacterium]|nr:NosD domain-containing protein [Streptosporangiaceae bacterium]